MPHMPATHLTITPKCAYINGELISVMKDALELSAPSQTGVQTVTLTITPTTVTFLNEDDPDTINAVYEAVAHHTQGEINNKCQERYLVNFTREARDNWKRQEAARAKRTPNTRT